MEYIMYSDRIFKPTHRSEHVYGEVHKTIYFALDVLQDYELIWHIF